MAKVKGIWVFNDTLPDYTKCFNSAGTKVSFTSGGRYFVRLYFTWFPDGAPVSMRYGAIAEYEDSQDTYPDAYIWTDIYGGPIWANDDFKTIDFGSTEQEVSDEFYTWFTANAKPVVVASIQYNGSTIVSLFGGDTATLKCKGMKMESDVVVEVAEQTGGGSCSRNHVIEVGELPTENIDEGAVYSCGGKYYKWANEFDLIVSDGEKAGSMIDVLAADEAMTVSLKKIPTKTTEGVLVSDMNTVYHFYYIEDEADVFLYVDLEGTGEYDWFSLSGLGLPNGGVISDIGEATTEGYYVLMICGWRTYTNVVGEMKILANGTYEIADKASVIVDCPSTAIVGMWKFNVTYGDDYGYIDLPQYAHGDPYEFVDYECAINFTCAYHGEPKNFVKIGYSCNDKYGDTYLYFWDADGNRYIVANGFAVGSQWHGYMEGSIDDYDTVHLSDIVDFGAEPQVVPEWLKTFMGTVAAPKYTIVQTE